MVKTRSPFLTFLTLIAGLSICLGISLLVVSGINLQTEVRRKFGPPDPTLGRIQQIYLSIALLFQSEKLTKPANLIESNQEFIIEPGEATLSVIQRLEVEGLIKSASAFRHYLQYKGLDKTLQAGKYTLSSTMTSIQIASKLQDASPDQVTFIILPGWRIEEVAAALPTSGLDITPDDFLSATASMPDLYASKFHTPPGASVEGFLLPDTYEVKRDINAERLIEMWLLNFDDNLSADIRNGIEKQGLTIFQAVILASMVQKEAIRTDEMPTIASVFLNRLAIGMRLDSDPTVQYILGYDKKKKTWWRTPLQTADFEIDSPYNTYKYSGLPPGPIANPGLEAITAVAFPAQTPYYYFRASCAKDGRHVFSQTYQEHIENACP
jgi:UPF0755 protein